MNDLIRLAMERATKLFGDKGDGLFNAAGFSKEIMDLANLRGAVDGHLVRAMLTGRTDVVPLKGSHYRLVWEARQGDAMNFCPFSITVNGRQRQWSSDIIGYHDIVTLVGRPGATPTITYRMPGDPARQAVREAGELLPGEVLAVRDGMVINAHDTSRA